MVKLQTPGAQYIVIVTAPRQAWIEGIPDGYAGGQVVEARIRWIHVQRHKVWRIASVAWGLQQVVVRFV